MSRWHKSTCGEPDVHPRDSIPSCSTCGETAVWNPAPGKAPGIPPLPEPPKNGVFELWWPSSVSYTDSSDDGSNLNDANSSTDFGVEMSHQGQARAVPAVSIDMEEVAMATPSPQTGQAATSAPRCRPSQLVYAPLSKNHLKEIRLLRLLKGRLDDAIHGELVIAPLQDQMDFTALSYTWADEDGDSSRNTVIYLGKHWDMFAVTQNCVAALRQMRLPDRHLIVWVDAICIDQGNHVERNHQVGLMTEVYSSAQQVFVYLGDGRPEITSTVTKARWPKERPTITPAAAQRFFSLTYFSRIWVVQEVANGKLVTLHYGNKGVDWAALQLVPSFAAHLPAWIKAEYNKSKPSCREFAQLLLDTSTSTHASDPRDSVFALFGLAKDCASQGLVADYQLTLPEVYIGAAAFVILNLGDRRVLRYAVGFNADGIPTWVPAWGKARRRPILNKGHRIQPKELLLPAVAATHPTNCGCDLLGKVSISKHLGAIKMLAATILDLTEFNLHGVSWYSARNFHHARSLKMEFVVLARVNETELLPTGKLVILHGSNTIFHVRGGNTPGQGSRVTGRCDIFIWRPGASWPWSWSSEETLARHGSPATATQAMESVLGRLTSTKLKQMLEVEQEIRDYVLIHHPSLYLPQIPSNMSHVSEEQGVPDTIYSLASGWKGKVIKVTKKVNTKPPPPGIPARSEVPLEFRFDPHLRAHLDFWATSQFWDLFGELGRQHLVGEPAFKLKQQLQQAHDHSQKTDVDVYHMKNLFDGWIFQAFSMRETRKAMSTPSLEEEFLNKLRKWVQEARYFERCLAIRLVCPPDSGHLYLQVGKLKFPIADFGNQRDCLPEIRGISWPFFEPWPGMAGTTPSDVRLHVLKVFDDFRRCVRAALEEAHTTSAKAGLLDVKTAMLVVDDNYTRAQAARENGREEYALEMDELKATCSMYSFMKALVPQERVWEEMELF